MHACCDLVERHSLFSSGEHGQHTSDVGIRPRQTIHGFGNSTLLELRDYMYTLVCIHEFLWLYQLIMTSFR